MIYVAHDFNDPHCQQNGKSRHGSNLERWIDDLQQPFNSNALQPSVVKVNHSNTPNNVHVIFKLSKKKIDKP